MKAYTLDRFIKAQADMFEKALAELRAGKKRSHWMWFIFPQLKQLGISDRAIYYGIDGIGEAEAYLQDPYLKGNLITASRALLLLGGSDPIAVMGKTDALKLCSSMTLFEAASPDTPEFSLVLDKFYGGMRDEQTLRILGL